MKITDQTPFRAANGEISIVNRIQATLKFGFAWHGRVLAQDKVIPILEKSLERGFTMLRNVKLHGTDIILPMVLLGPPGIFVLVVLPEKGVFRAKGEEWGTLDNEQFNPSSKNPMREVAQIARVLQVYLDRSGFKGMVTVDPLLIAADPGAHVETVRPAVRVVMIDALERFAVSMTQARAVLSPEAAAKIGDIIINGSGMSAKDAEPAPAPIPEEPPIPVYNPYGDGSFKQQESGGSSGNLTDELTFAFDDPEQAPAESQPKQATTSPQPTKKPVKRAPAKGKKAKGGGLTKPQIMLLGGAVAAEIVILAIFAWLLLSGQ